MSEKIKKFEDLHIWKEGMQLSLELYNELEVCKDFGKFKDLLNTFKYCRRF